MTDQTAVVARSQQVSLVRDAMEVDEICKQVGIIQNVMKSVMKEGQHYGVIPGCGDKPTLLKPGAEKLALTFRLRILVDPAKDITITDLGNGHREYTIVTHVMASSGIEIATGLGSCSTMEAKYRYRRGEAKVEDTGESIPKDYKDNKAAYRKKGFVARKVDGEWKWMKIVGGPGETEKTENPDIADTYNTCLKMAKKRSAVDAVISATAASDIYTQDLEDIASQIANYDEKRKSNDDSTAQGKVQKAREEAAQRQAKAEQPESKEVVEPTEVQKPAEAAPMFEPPTGKKMTKAVLTKIEAAFANYDIDTPILEKWRQLPVDEWTESVRGELLVLHKDFKAGNLNKEELLAIISDDQEF